MRVLSAQADKGGRIQQIADGILILSHLEWTLVFHFVTCYIPLGYAVRCALHMCCLHHAADAGAT